MHPGCNKSLYTLMGTGPTNGETVTASFDTLGHDFAQIEVVLGTANTTSNKPTTLKISEGDTTSSYTDIRVGGTDFTIPAADTANPNIYRFNIDLRARKRYLKVTVSPRTTQEAIAVCHLGGPYWSEELPLTTTKAGVHLIDES